MTLALIILAILLLLWYFDVRFKRDGGDELKRFEEYLWKKYLDDHRMKP